MEENKQKESAFSWLMWWKVDNAELEKQVQEYGKLSVIKSKKGIAFLLEILGVVTYLALFVLTGSNFMLLLTVLNIIFAIFIFKGIRWSMVVMMIWNTYNTFSNIWLAYYNNTSNKGAMPWSLLFWTISMHILYYAFKVEQLRQKKKNNIVLEAK